MRGGSNDLGRGTRPGFELSPRVFVFLDLKYCNVNRFKYLSRGRIAKRGERNKTELRYEEVLRANSDIAQWWFEPFTLRLSHPDRGQPAKYTPDFMILMKDGTTFIDDVKGAGLDDTAAIVRVKTAAELFPLWVFRVAKERRKNDGGGFEVKTV